MTPPHNVVLYETTDNSNDVALDLLVHEAVSHGIRIPGILAEKSLAGRFSNKYASAHGSIGENVKKMRIYKLDRVNDIFFSPGKLRLALHNDTYYLPYWNSSFNLDCRIGITDITDSVDKVKRLINDKTLYIWEDGIPVSQAAMGRRTLNGAVVNAVYTPPHYRGKGYAISCVGSFSQYLLENGYKFCSLFTDLANPISNSIYMKIWYKPICDTMNISFQDE